MFRGRTNISRGESWPKNLKRPCFCEGRVCHSVVSGYFVNLVLDFSEREGLSEGFTESFKIRKRLSQNQLAQRPENSPHTFFLILTIERK
jgi:hypothetical protein